MDILSKQLTLKDHFAINNLSINPAFEFKKFTHPYLGQVVDVFTRSFCLYEPMTSYLKMDMNLYKKFAYAVAEKAIIDRLSVIALKDGQVAAFALVEDIANPCPIPDFDPKFKYILELLESLGKSYFSNRIINSLDISHLFITAVDENFRGQNLSTQVNFQAMNISSQAGFSRMYCEFTHEFNEKGVIHHLTTPFIKIGSQLYRDFVFENQKPFSKLPGAATSYLWQI